MCLFSAKGQAQADMRSQMLSERRRDRKAQGQKDAGKNISSAALRLCAFALISEVISPLEEFRRRWMVGE